MKIRKSSPAWRLTALVMIISLLLVACASNTPIPTSTSTSLPLTQTPTLTPAPTATPSIAPPEAQGSALDQALLDEIWNSDHLQAQKTQWEAWIHYWLNATNPPIVTDIKELRFALLTDPSNTPQGGADPRLNEKMVLLLTWHDPADKTKTVQVFFPANTTAGGFRTEPPTVESPYEIETGTEPLFLSDGENLTLAWRRNDFVRVEAETGLAREAIDKSGQWVPVYGIETIKPEAYTPEQLELINNSPSVLKDKMPLEKGFATGPFADTLFYFGPGDEVKALFDPETNQVHPAMIWGVNNDMLVINYRSKFTYDLNPKMKDESPAKILEVIPDYFRAKICTNKVNVEIPTEINVILGNPSVQSFVDKGCTITLIDWDFEANTSFHRTLAIKPHIPILYRVIDTVETGLSLNRHSNGLYLGKNYEVDNDGILVITRLREHGLETSSISNQPMEDIAYLLTFMLSGDKSVADTVIRKYLVDEQIGTGRLGNQYAEPAIISGSKLDIVY